MKSSKSKRQLTTEDICREYYESQLFRPTGNDEASPAYFFADASINLEVADSSFKGIELDSLIKEMIAINLELFGLAWLDHNYEPDKELSPSEHFFTREITFAKQYIQDTSRGDIWEIMGFYNDVIGETVAEQTISEGLGRLRDIPKAIRNEDYEKVREEFLIERVKLLADMFNRYFADSECRDRLVMRFLAVPCNISEITVLSQKFSLKLTERLGCTPKQTGLFALQRMIIGLYSNAVNYLDAVRQYGSYEAYKDTIMTFREGLVRVIRKQKQK